MTNEHKIYNLIFKIFYILLLASHVFNVLHMTIKKTHQQIYSNYIHQPIDFVIVITNNLIYWRVYI